MWDLEDWVDSWGDEINDFVLELVDIDEIF